MFSYSRHLSGKHSFTLLALTDRRNDRRRNEYTCCAWAGGTFFPVVPLCQFLVLAGNRFWFYILMYLEYNTVVMLCQFFDCGGKQFLVLRTYLVYFLYDLKLFYSISFYFAYFSCTAQIYKLKLKSKYYLRINIGNQVKMQTPAITL